MAGGKRPDIRPKPRAPGWVRVDDWDGTPRLHEFRSLEARRLIPYLSLRHGWADILMPIALTGALLLTLLVLIWDHFLAVLGLFSRRAKRRHRRLQKEVTKLWSYPMVKFEARPALPPSWAKKKNSSSLID